MNNEEKLKEAKRLYKTATTDQKYVLESLFPELKESEDEKTRKWLIDWAKTVNWSEQFTVTKEHVLAWLEKQCEQKPTLPKWKYKKDHTPLLRDSIILNKYGGVAKSPSGAIVSDVWVIDYDELAKLPKEELEKQGEKDKVTIKKGEQEPSWSKEDEAGLCDALWAIKQAKRIAKDENDMGNLWYAENWLKSLKQRYTWKPSEEQIKAIRLARSFVTDDFSETQSLSEKLIELEEQLKKLRDESMENDR